ncbi:TPA: WxL domain-containing protein [Enterococcus faecalis]|nr:WxL domain-containing protein [Enterococcus faecalis]
MKKKQLFAGAAVLAMLSAGGVTTALAEEGDNYDGATSAETEAKVTFLEDDDTGTIVDPDDGDEDGNGGVDPVDPTNPNGAELMISYASNLNFGTQSKSATSWNALADKVWANEEHTEKKEVTPFVATKDSRGTSRKGWSLQAKQDDVFTDGSGAVLEGAELSLSNLRYAELEGAPKASKGKIVLGEEAKEISLAGTNEGIGAWSLALGSLGNEGEQGRPTNGVTLSVPSTSAKNTGTYSTTVTWSLVADPTAD